MTHKAGFVNIVGNPNVGKSTLMNALTGMKLSIITSKVQTTRHRIMGIVNGNDFQIVFSDTPGIIQPVYKLQEYMVKASYSALTDADIIIYITDVGENLDPEQDYLKKLRKKNVPVLLVINKIDLSTESKVKQLIVNWNKILPKAEIIPVSAINRFNIDKIFNLIIELLPESPPYYPKDEITDKSERFFAGEIIREKILLNYRKEIPYSVEIEIDSFRESDNMIRITGVIYVLRESQKGILIGHQGQALKKTGIMARKDLEKFFNKKIYLDLRVKIKKDWRDNSRSLRQLGYH